MSHASEAVEGLLAAAQAAYGPAWQAGAAFAKAATAVSQASDVVDALQAMIDLLVHAEMLHDAADAAVKNIRAKLASTMQDVGATAVQGTNHAAHLSRRPAFLSIDDESLVPPEFYVQPPPQLDKRALKEALKSKQVPGASLATPNDMVLVLRARKETPT